MTFLSSIVPLRVKTSVVKEYALYLLAFLIWFFSITAYCSHSRYCNCYWICFLFVTLSYMTYCQLLHNLLSSYIYIVGNIHTSNGGNCHPAFRFHSFIGVTTALVYKHVTYCQFLQSAHIFHTVGHSIIPFDTSTDSGLLIRIFVGLFTARFYFWWVLWYCGELGHPQILIQEGF